MSVLHSLGVLNECFLCKTYKLPHLSQLLQIPQNVFVFRSHPAPKRDETERERGGFMIASLIAIACVHRALNTTAACSYRRL